MKDVKTYSLVWGHCNDFSRLKIHGGWIVYSCSKDDCGIVTAESMTYVPDPKHEWIIK